MKKPPRRLAIFVLLALLLLTVIVSLAVGGYRMEIRTVVSGLLAGPFATGADASVLWHLRLPRVLLGLIVGSTLGSAGALMQGLFRNPLAEPGLVGVSSGAALGAVSILVIGASLLPNVPALSDLRLLPFAAFSGALVVSLMIQRLASAGGYTAVATLLLAGVAINALAGSLLGLSMYLADDAQLRSLTFWTLGSLGGATWKTLAIASPLCLVMLSGAPAFSGALNAIALGEAEGGASGLSG